MPTPRRHQQAAARSKASGTQPRCHACKSHCHCATVPLCHCAPAKVLAIAKDEAAATVMYMEEGNPIEVGVVLTSIKVKR